MTSTCHVITSAAFGMILGRPNELHCFLLAAPSPPPGHHSPTLLFRRRIWKMAGNQADGTARCAGDALGRLRVAHASGGSGSVERDEQASSCSMQRKQRSAAVDLAKGVATKASSGGRGGADPGRGMVPGGDDGSEDSGAPWRRRSGRRDGDGQPNHGKARPPRGDGGRPTPQRRPWSRFLRAQRPWATRPSSSSSLSYWTPPTSSDARLPGGEDAILRCGALYDHSFS
ncbi:hypothetical protein VPH35_028593 [Triticum aestivum]